MVVNVLKYNPTPEEIHFHFQLLLSGRSFVHCINKILLGSTKGFTQHSTRNRSRRTTTTAIDHHIESLSVSSFYYSHVHVMMAINGLDTHMVMVTDKREKGSTPSGDFPHSIIIIIIGRIDN